MEPCASYYITDMINLFNLIQQNKSLTNVTQSESRVTANLGSDLGIRGAKWLSIFFLTSGIQRR